MDKILFSSVGSSDSLYPCYNLIIIDGGYRIIRANASLLARIGDDHSPTIKQNCKGIGY